ncbi:MAG: hypothetical protein WBD40_05835 [Tepidisphaeraceae bacterium]
MLVSAGLLLLLWIGTLFRGYAVKAYTEVLAPAGPYASHQRGAASSHGRLWFAYVRAEVVEESAKHEKRLRVYSAPFPHDEPLDRYNAPAWLAWLGIDWRGKDNSSVDAQGHYAYREVFFCVPYWLLIVLAGGIGWSIGHRPRLVRRRIKRGLCVACGYDVRATPERCPECGLVPAEAQRAAPASATA